MKKTAKTEKIIDCALLLLKTKGDHGVTMRQIAAQTEMSLSNVQYYFKNKDELLKAMADRYFETCLDDMRNAQALTSKEHMPLELAEMLRASLSHGLEISEMCRIFREYWAIATRNDVIVSYLRNYYAEMVKIISEKLRPIAASETALARATSMIIPYVEGYSVTALAMPQDIHEVTEMLTNIVTDLLTEKL